jgi:putative phage-type endonuclease
MNAQLQPAAAPGPRYYIGGGNVAGILGVSPYKSPLDEYLVMLAANEEISPEREAFFKRRKALEPFAAEVFAQVTGLHITDRNIRYKDAEHAFIRAEVDFETSDGGNGETKTVHPLAAKDWGPSGSDEIPVYVTAQAMHGLMVTGRPHAWIHALVGLDDDRIYRIERDDDLIEGIRAHEVAFWNDHVLPLVPPAPTTIEDLRALYPHDSGRVIDVASDDAIAQDVERWRAVKAVLKAADTECDELEERLKLFLRDATMLTIDGKPALTWKAQGDTRLDQKAFAAAHPDLFEQFKATKTIRVLRAK